MEWISVNDQLPEKRKVVLISIKSKTRIGKISCFLEGRKPFWIDWFGEHVSPSHWMPLPNKPKV